LSDDQYLIIERQLDAPIEDVWAMWTDPVHFAAWYGPTGATISTADFDLRVGGRRIVCMKLNAMRMWFAGEFLEIAPHLHLAYTEFVSDEHGSPLADTAPDGHPATTEVRVRFKAHGDSTTMSLTHVGVPHDSPGATGWTMAIDKLDVYLATAKRGA
jgi:uncharacterized protein YndB with AHSA1/START domain